MAYPIMGMSINSYFTMKKEKRLIIGFFMNVVTDVCYDGTKDGWGFSGQR